MTAKRPGWEERLFAYVAESEGAAFVRGENCCALWVLGAVDAMCETDHAAEWRGNFNTLEAAHDLMRARGWEHLGEALAAITGATVTGERATRARLGDILCVPYREGMAFGGGTLALVYAGNRVVMREENKPGLSRYPVRQLLPLDLRVYRV